MTEVSKPPVIPSNLKIVLEVSKAFGKLVKKIKVTIEVKPDFDFFGRQLMDF